MFEAECKAENLTARSFINQKSVQNVCGQLESERPAAEVFKEMPVSVWVNKDF